jgi:hypothetical protein
VVFEISTGSSFGRYEAWQAGSDIIHSISRPHFCISGLLTSCIYLFPFKSYSTFSLRLEIPIGAELLGGFGNSRPLNVCVHQRDPEKARPCVEPLRLSHHACLCDAPFGRYAIARKKN